MYKIPVSILSVLMLAQTALAQDKVKENTNTKELAKMEQEFRAAEELNQMKVKQYAEEHGLLVTHYLPDGRIIKMVGFDETGTPLYQQTENSKASATISTNKLYPSATVASKYNLAGRGFSVGEWDGGIIRLTHREFEGRAVQSDNGTVAMSEHATHVAGTLIAGGITPTAKGMAYQAKLLANDWDNDDAEMSALSSQGLLVSNHSYGTPCGWDYDANNQLVWLGSDAINTQYDYKFGFYDSQARDWDRIAYNAPHYLIVKSAGNSRGTGPGNGSRPDNGPYDCLPTYSVAKNVLTVGAVNGLANGYTTPNAVIMSTFSSWGPTDDGRIKPDIVGDGVNVSSSGMASDQQYVTLSGTSMSGPSVAGSCLLLQEMFSNSHNRRKMKSATLKGLVIHTADECGTTAGPDYRFGWGLMNTKKASDVILNDKVKSLLTEDTLYNLGVNEFTVTAKGSESLVATLCWTDYQGTPGPAAYNSRIRMLVNDLDLRVINESNQVESMPWRLVADSANYAAKKGDNIIDNVEKIELTGPTAGQTYKIKVSHKGTLFAGNNQPTIQPYSIIVTGIVAGDTNATCIPRQYMNAKTGIFDDGSGASKNYASNGDCGWVVNPTDSNAIVVAVFKSFNVHTSDTLYAYSGTDATGTLIGKYTGTTLPDTMRSTTAQMFLNFKTSSADNAPGWEIQYSSLSKPKFDFAPDAKTICAGNTSTYSVTPLNSPTNDWVYSWTLTGASIENPVVASPTVTYANVGVYSASLTVTNKAGSTTLSKSNVVTAKPSVAPNMPPYFQGFEATSFPVDNTNPDLNWTTTADANPWTRNTLSPFEGVAAIRIRNVTNKKDIRELVSPSFNIENIPSSGRYITFRMAYARISTAASADQLRVLASTDCGKTWTEYFKRSNTTNPKLSTIGDGVSDVVPGSFIPEPFQYRKDSISLASLPADVKNLIVKFEMTSEKGNFLYMDNFEISSITAADKLLATGKLALDIFPNPTRDQSSLVLRNPNSGSIAFELLDVTGKVMSSRNIKTNIGAEVSTISTADLFGKVGPGIYFIRAKSGSEEKVIRWLRN